jgi:hypothetical protein
MTDEHQAIHELRLQITALLGNSGASAGCQAIAALMAAAYACRASGMPEQLAAFMLVSYFTRDPFQ